MDQTVTPFLRVLAGETQARPPVWFMRQAGRYLPEYRKLRAEAPDFIAFCLNPEMAAEATLQPMRRFGFDAAIVFADILLIPRALGQDVWFETGEGPRLGEMPIPGRMAELAPAAGEHLSAVGETLSIVRAALEPERTMIGFAGAPWTVATYMIAGRGTPDQGPAHALKASDRATFAALIDLIADATIDYLSEQVKAGAEVVKLFDSWAGALPGPQFHRYAIAPARRIAAAIAERHPDVPLIGFPRGAGAGYAAYVRETGVAAVALDTSVDPRWAAETLQPRACVQGNLDPLLLVLGGEALVAGTRAVVEAFRGGPHVFNLGHGITPDASPDNVARMLEAIRG